MNQRHRINKDYQGARNVSTMPQCTNGPKGGPFRHHWAGKIFKLPRTFVSFIQRCFIAYKIIILFEVITKLDYNTIHTVLQLNIWSSVLLFKTCLKWYIWLGENYVWLTSKSLTTIHFSLNQTVLKQFIWIQTKYIPNREAKLK